MATHEYINKIIQGDCLEVMKGIPDNSIDLVLTDPPYGIDFLSPWTDNHDKIENDGFDVFQENAKIWIENFNRVLTDTGCLCCCCSGGGKRPVSAIFTMELVKQMNLIQTVIWDKKTIGLGWRYRPSYETIIIGSKSKDKYNFYDTSKSCSNIVRYNNVIPQKGDHPTPKPVDLMAHFLRIHTNKGDTVLDPFLGSGTTAVACKMLDRNYIGIELSEKYCEIARDRIENTLPLFDGLEAE
jgi:DNA modification methylase